MENQRISSLHDDIYVPKATQHLGEYSDYPVRFDVSEKSVITRLEQFGINLEAVNAEFGKEVKDLSWKEYNELLAQAIRTKYDVIIASVFDQYIFPTNEDPSTAIRRSKMFNLIEQFRDMDARCGVTLVKRKADIKEGGNIVLSLEAGAHLIQSMEDLKIIAEADVKLFGFQYGEDTPLATSEGLTTLGKEAVSYLVNNNLIVDLAHSGEKTRQGIMSIAEDEGRGHLISYTHGSTEDDLMSGNKERVLTKEEVKRIVRMDGIIGLGVTEPFFSGARGIAERIYDIAQLDGGIHRVAIGTDFGGVSPSEMKEIKSIDDFYKLADILADDFNMNDLDIDRVLRANVRKWIQEAID
ncbi:membrane dipeptidase [Patescibacteria group bacterium]